MKRLDDCLQLVPRQDGFYAWGHVLGNPRLPRASRLTLTWAELTQELQAA